MRLRSEVCDVEELGMKVVAMTLLRLMKGGRRVLKNDNGWGDRGER